MLKLKIQYFGHRMQRADSLEKILRLARLKAGEGDDRGQDGWMASPTQWTQWHHLLNEFEQAPGDSEGQGKLHHATVHGAAKSRTQLSN